MHRHGQVESHLFGFVTAQYKNETKLTMKLPDGRLLEPLQETTYSMQSIHPYSRSFVIDSERGQPGWKVQSLVHKVLCVFDTAAFFLAETEIRFAHPCPRARSRF